jgi:hypothetical protein
MRGSLFFTVAVLCGACCPSNQYSGDGTIENRGCWPFPNYRVSFRSIPLSGPGATRYHVRRLPDLDVIVGFDVTTRSGQTCEQLQNDPAIDGLVAIEVHDSTGRLLARVSDRLSQWTWSSAIVQPDPSLPPQSCLVYAEDLDFKPRGLRDLTLDFKVIEAGGLPVQLTPVVESYAIYTP